MLVFSPYRLENKKFSYHILGEVRKATTKKNQSIYIFESQTIVIRFYKMFRICIQNSKVFFFSYSHRKLISELKKGSALPIFTSFKSNVHQNVRVLSPLKNKMYFDYNLEQNWLEIYLVYFLMAKAHIMTKSCEFRFWPSRYWSKTENIKM